MKFISTTMFVFLCSLTLVFGQTNTNQSKFKQLGPELPTPNVYRAGSGAPGHAYWQQKADYKINMRLDDKQHRFYGDETITYYNNSPDPLNYLWLQLDQNVRAKDSETHLIKTGSISEKLSTSQLERMLPNDFDGGFKIEHVKDKGGEDLPYTIVKTMMRVDLPDVLESGSSVTIQVKWWYNVQDAVKMGGRSGYEYFPEDDNNMYHIAQFFPRMCTYTDVEGWQNKQFLGRGEFALTFGDYDVNITVPADFVVSATGELQNESEVLTEVQRERLEKSKTAKEPVLIINQKEAEKNEKKRSSGEKTWKFRAENVRDYAFCTSRKLIWDAVGVKFGDRTVMAMSFYPKEGNPLWEQYSTKAVVHTLKWYSHYTFDYPYPVAISTHASFTGMEYPMICFNFGRPEKDGTYSKRIKYGMIGVIIHEVGHNYFPMIVNSDERQWTWMDEGLNSFLQYLAEQQWERDYPSRRDPRNIVNYMKGDKSNIMPIMTNSESIPQFGNNAYAKPATALNILRETVMGRELFDYAFKEYSQRWMFKHPEPADFFRSMEDASGVDLDWFWRGWFYTTDHVDMSLESVKLFQVNTQNPDIEKPLAKKIKEASRDYVGNIRNREISKTQDEIDPDLVDFYSTYDPNDVDAIDRKEYQKIKENMDPEMEKVINGGLNYYEIEVKNVGGLVMPLIFEFEFEDGSKEVQYIPAEIWKMDKETISKIFAFDKKIKGVVIDPYLETADTNMGNNVFPESLEPTRFEVYKGGSWRNGGENPMQRAKRANK